MRAARFTVKLPMHFTESCPSGRRSTIGNRVGAKSVSRVQIPDSPPASSHGAPFDAPCFTPCGGVAEWLNAAVSKTVYPVFPGTRVRIPPPPPFFPNKQIYAHAQGTLLHPRRRDSNPQGAEPRGRAERPPAQRARPGRRAGRSGRRAQPGGHPSSSAIFYLTSKYTLTPRAPFCTRAGGVRTRRARSRGDAPSVPRRSARGRAAGPASGPQDGGRPALAGEMPGMKPTPYLFGRRAGILYRYPADSIGGRHIRERASPGME